MQTLQSYVLGRWTPSSSAPVLLHNPTTEEAIAEVRSGGFDARAVVEHARKLGAPALAKLSFAQRGELCKALASALHAKREELIEVSVLNGGTTRGDAKFDIDGAIGTLMAYADLAAKLPERPFLVDGAGLQLGRTARFWGQHVWLTRPGVALHINAFNFPAWGMLEKLACALVAGVPVIEKPGTPTALLAWRVAQILVESGKLPEGSYQFIAGSVGELMDQLGPQDCVAFTGSSATGAKLRAHPAVVRHNLRLNVEADSLNAAVLGAAVEAGSETYNLFLANVVLDMTQKTGQKCTATRRVLVPRERLAEVRADLVAELGRIVVGDPADKATRMGPLSSKSQFDDVRAGIERLAKGGEIVCGGAQPARAKGWFLAPTLIAAREASEPLFHAEEVFGPCASLLPYSGEPEEAAQLVALGGGGLVTSAYSNDNGWCERYLALAGPWHGRVWFASDKSSEQSLAPGMVLPSMVHGGPGRAGGGEELGGERGLHFYMQRVAVQGFKGLVEASFGQPAASASASA
ncbi:MAG: 3,4-dehydroadipyl-CoA semialdehyde dehydrogenase [Planctomycetes bacterium]|nr:3,4-dehydroadipyl-CoA semialdehyde dehydrogenase [Planctomycetota bacterium]